MNSNDAAVEVALLEIAKDLLQASDDLAPTDPSASAKLAHEAYEIGRDLGIVRNHLALSTPKAAVDSTTNNAASAMLQKPVEATTTGHHEFPLNNDGQRITSRSQNYEEDGDDELFRILDRQRAVVPNFAELAPTRNSSWNGKQLAFETPEPRRSGWFSWMRSKDLRHAS